MQLCLHGKFHGELRTFYRMGRAEMWTCPQPPAILSPAAWPCGPGRADTRAGEMHYSCASSHPWIIQYSTLNNLFQRYLYSSSPFVKQAAK